MKIKHPCRHFKTPPVGGWSDHCYLRRDNRQVRLLARKHGLPILQAGIYLDWIKRGEN